MEGVTTPDGASTDQVGLARTARRRPPRRLAPPDRAEHRRPPPHGDLAGGQDRRHEPGAERVDRLHQHRARGRARRPARVLGRLSHDGLERPAERDEHRALDGRRRELGAPARLGRPGGAQSYASNTAATVRADGSTLQASPGRSAPGSTPASRRRRQPRLPGAARPVRLRPQPRDDAADRTVLAWYSSASRPPRRAGPGRGGGRRARGQRGDDAEHERHAGRHARPHAPRGARRAAASTSPTRPAIRRGPRAPVAGRRSQRAADRARGGLGQPGRGGRGGRRRAGCGWSGRRASGIPTCSHGGRTRTRRSSARP